MLSEQDTIREQALEIMASRERNGFKATVSVVDVWEAVVRHIDERTPSGTPRRAGPSYGTIMDAMDRWFDRVPNVDPTSWTL